MPKMTTVASCLVFELRPPINLVEESTSLTLNWRKNKNILYMPFLTSNEFMLCQYVQV